jgi:hypothetical protein
MTDIFSMKNKKSASGYNYIPCFFLLIKSIEYLNFRHFRHFAILGISLDNLIVSQKDLATKYTKIITKVEVLTVIRQPDSSLQTAHVREL